jgi:transposase
VKDIDAIVAAERAINGQSPEQRLDIRRRTISPLVEALEVRLRSDRAKLSSKSATANAIDYMFSRSYGEFLQCPDRIHMLHPAIRFTAPPTI